MVMVRVNLQLLFVVPWWPPYMVFLRVQKDYEIGLHQFFLDSCIVKGTFIRNLQLCTGNDGVNLSC